MINSTFPCASVAHAKDNRQQFGIRQSLGTVFEQLFSGPIFRRPFFDAGWVSTHGFLGGRFGGSWPFQAYARRSLYHNGWPSPTLLKLALLDIRLPDDAGSQGGRWVGLVS